jgi:type II secretory pathway pseudopilin PulG
LSTSQIGIIFIILASVFPLPADGNLPAANVQQRAEWSSFSFFSAEGRFSMSKLLVPKGRRGTSLTETLVVVGVIAILVAILIPAIYKSRYAGGSSNRSDSLNNLKQIGIAANAHNDAVDYLPCSGTTAYNVNSLYYTGPKAYANLGSYAYQLLPYMEQQNWAQNVVDHLGIAADTPIKTFLCKGRGRPSSVGASVDYAWNMAINTSHTSDDAAPAVVLPPTGGASSETYLLRSLKNIPDGGSNTILAGHKYLPTIGAHAPSYVCKDGKYLMVGGTVDTAVGSYEYRRDSTEPGQNLWGGPFVAGGLFVFADGSARMIPYSNANAQSGTSNFAYMIRPDDGQTVTLP